MEITSITKNDIPMCAEAFRASYNRLPWNYNWKIEDAVIYLNEYVECPQFKGFMCCDGSTVAGALFGHTKTWWTNNQFMIDELFIAPEKQGLGLGKKLLNTAEEH